MQSRPLGGGNYLVPCSAILYRAQMGCTWGRLLQQKDGMTEAMPSQIFYRIALHGAPFMMPRLLLLRRSAAAGAYAVFQLSTAVRAESGSRTDRRLLNRLLRLVSRLRFLRLLLALTGSCLQLLHIGNGKYIIVAVAGLIGKLVVDGNDILHQQNDHHHHFISKTDDNGTKDNVQQPDAAHPCVAARPIFLDVKQLQHTK